MESALRDENELQDTALDRGPRRYSRWPSLAKIQDLQEQLEVCGLPVVWQHKALFTALVLRFLPPPDL